MNSWETGRMIGWVVFAILIVLCLFALWLLLRKKKTGAQIGNAQILGVEEEQKDYFGTAQTQNGILAVVADGIGRGSDARLSAELAVEAFLAQYRKADLIEDCALFLRRTLKFTNIQISRQVADDSCGTTVAAAILRGSSLYWLSVGNSAVMIANREEIRRLNLSYTELYINETAYKRGMSKRVDRYLGLDDQVKAESGAERLGRQEYVLLCTDGVYNQATETEMLRQLRQRGSAQDKAQSILLNIARRKRLDQDNATLVIVKPPWN